MVKVSSMSKGTIHRVIEVFHEAFSDLHVNIPMKDLEEMAVLVHRAMTLQTRHFHTLDHVFSFTSAADPIQSIAALFHDVVYYQVDEGFIPEIQEIIHPYIHQAGDQVSLKHILPKEDRILQLTLEVFNFTPGKMLSPNDGLNEFLSALVMAKKLQGLISDHDLLRLIVCIEATIPFQGKNDKGETHFDILETRLRHINKKYYCCLDDEDIIEALQLAVKFSNKDVESFSEKSAGRFLDNTWKLLPETNVALRSAEIYSIREYRQALNKMELFFAFLNPENVFNQYHGVPSNRKFQQMVRQARTNVLTAREYLRIKLLSAAILEALAEITGGDAPLSLFSEDLQSKSGERLIYQDFLQLPIEYPPVDNTSTLYKLFNEGRPAETAFDMKTSPLALFLFTTLERSEIDRLVELARKMFDKEIHPYQFLREINPPILVAISNACAQMVITRREKLNEFTQSL
jgi:hypothetical protein